MRLRVDNSFKSLKEFLEYVLSGKKFVYLFDDTAIRLFDGEKIVTNCGKKIGFSTLASYENYQPYIEPKKKKQITLYRYTYERDHYKLDQSIVKELMQSEWMSGTMGIKNKVVYMETKTIEIDDDSV